MRVYEAAILVLRRNGCDGIMWGDVRLAHEIADELGWEHEGPWTHQRVINALGKTPGTLIPVRYRLNNGRIVRGFNLGHP